MEPQTLAARRRAAHLTQRELAHMLGISRALVEHAETGRQRLRPIHVERAERIFVLLETAHTAALNYAAAKVAVA